MDSYSGMYLTLFTWLVCLLHFSAITKAEVSCTSCPLPTLVKIGDVRNNARTLTSMAAEKTLVSFARTRLQPILEGVYELGQDARPSGAPNSTEVEVAARSTATGFSAKTPPEQTTQGELEKVGKKDGAFLRRKRSAAQLDEFGTSARSGDSAESADAMLFVDGQKLRRNRDEGKVATSRSEEPKVSCSTFALAGDSAHNHAVVYWTGHNSSVSVIPHLFCTLYREKIEVVRILYATLLEKHSK